MTQILIPRSEILDLGDYERKRDEIRQAAIKARAIRRIELGPNATLAFENRETLTYQVHEMLRAERIAKDSEVAHEIETYSELLPSSSSLSATLMIEFPDREERAVKLTEMLGLDKHLYFDIDGAGASTSEFDQRQIDEERLSAVQFVRFPLLDVQRDQFLSGSAARIVCDHPSYTHSAELSVETASALVADLRQAAALEA